MHIPVDFGQANLVFTGAGVPTGAEMTIGFSNDFSGDADAIASAFYSATSDHILPSLNDQLTLAKVAVKLGPNDTGADGLSSGSDTGGDSGTGASPAVAYLIHKRTGLGGRHGRGRMYCPGVLESKVNGAGTIDATFRTGFESHWADWQSELETAGLGLVLLHAGSTPDPTPITGLIVEGMAATQRRRQRR